MGASGRRKAGYEEETIVQRTKAKRGEPHQGPAFLTVLTGESVGRVFELGMGASVIGRQAEVEVQLADEGISRQHARIVRDEDGSAKIVDLDSTNGTYINGRRIHAEGLREGDRIRVGQSATLDFRYSYRDSSASELPGRARSSDHTAEPGAPVAVSRSASDRLSGGYDNLAATLDSLGKVYAQHGQHDEAIAAYRRTLQIREMKLGKEHPAVASILDALGVALQDAQRHDAALDCHRRSLAIYEAQSRRPPRETGHVLAHIGTCQLVLDQAPAALAALERAHARAVC